MADTKSDIDVAEDATVEELVEDLASSSRRDRQHAASRIAQIAAEKPEDVMPFVDRLIDGLNRKEARTRWELLDALSRVCAVDASLVESALEDAEGSLFDEQNGTVRLSAFRLYCRFGQASAANADKVWPLLNEAIQCYHGDPEFQDMLIALLEFSAADLSGQVKEGLRERMSFDAENNKGMLQKRAKQIFDNVSC